MLTNQARQPGYSNTVVAAAPPTSGGGQGNTSLYATGGVGTAPAKWTEYGILRRTAYHEADGRPVYALVNATGRTIIYATPLPNLTLEPYLGHQLTLYGPTFYNQNERVNEISVSHVAEPKTAPTPFRY
jgi:hypothetical protein